MGFDLNWVPYVIARPSGRKRVYDVLDAVKKRTLDLERGIRQNVGSAK